MSSPATVPAPDPTSPSKRLGIGPTFLVGALVFGLFFGAGNLIFPVGLGRAAGDHATIATIGFLVTATGLPILGVIASALSGSTNVRDMVALVGRRYALLFTCALYLTIGPAFAIPRTATVSYEIGFSDWVGSGSQTWALALFTLVFFALTLAAALRPGKIMDVVGRYLTPLFLVLLGIVVVAAFVNPMPHHTAPATGEYAKRAATQGFLDGYNTMDALASLAFAIVIIEGIRRLGVTRPTDIAREATKGGIIGGLAMAAVYGSLAYVGATSLQVAPDAENGGTTLAAVARHYFGSGGQVLIAAIVLVACLKTAIGLVTACAEMFATLFPRALSQRGWTWLFVVVSLAVANVGLDTIITYSVPVLMFLYPLAIVAILLGLLTRWLGDKPFVHRCTTGLVALAAFFDFVKALPFIVPGADSLVSFAGDVLPGYADGFGWVVPALLGLALGLTWERRRPRPHAPERAA